MSCIHFSASEDAWCDANAAPPLPKSRIPSRESKKHRLYRLADDPRPSIRAAVAGNLDAPHQLLRRLASDESKLVRSWVARNPATPQSVLRRLAKGQDPDVAAYARMRLLPRFKGSVIASYIRYIVVGVLMRRFARRA